MLSRSERRRNWEAKRRLLLACALVLFHLAMIALVVLAIYVARRGLAPLP